MLENKLTQMMADIRDGSDAKVPLESKMFPQRVAGAKVNLEGNLGANYVTPRGLKARMLNQVVRVQGIVTRSTIVKTKLQKSYHYTETTKQGTVRDYSDQYSIEGKREDVVSNAFPTQDNAGNAMTPDYGYCEYEDVQRLIIQEMPENAPTGQLPRSCSVLLQRDLVDAVKPGDRIEVTGVYKTIANLGTNHNGMFKTCLIATGIEEIADIQEDLNIQPNDIKNIRKLAKQEGVFKLMAKSVSPSIEGHLNIKKAVLLQLLGGSEHTLKNGSHLRGDINILMVGDPSTAKSQILRQVYGIAPLCINTTGRGASGVGLTAAVVHDRDTGEKHLEAGAMVLADRGMVCIDEFDKMNEDDRVAIHEVMEQQTVTISKAGIHTSLNARCSVIAAANPIFGDYDRSMPAAKNIGLPDSLLSRFDLVFAVLDEKNPHADTKIAERVIKNHQYHNRGQNLGMARLAQDDVVIQAQLNETDDKTTETQVYINQNNDFYGSSSTELLTKNFLRKYLHYAKKQFKPVMTKDAAEFVAKSYAMLRAKG